MYNSTAQILWPITAHRKKGKKYVHDNFYCTGAQVRGLGTKIAVASTTDVFNFHAWSAQHAAGDQWKVFPAQKTKKLLAGRVLTIEWVRGSNLWRFISQMNMWRFAVSSWLLLKENPRHGSSEWLFPARRILRGKRFFFSSKYRSCLILFTICPGDFIRR